jgi:hypothetical protein
VFDGWDADTRQALHDGDICSPVDRLAAISALDIAKRWRHEVEIAPPGVIAAMLRRRRVELARRAARLQEQCPGAEDRLREFFDVMIEHLRRERRALSAQRVRLPSAGARARARTVPRPRQRRDGSSRRSVRAGPDDDSHESEPPGEGSAGRLCECGCGRSLEGKRPQARTFNASCRQRVARNKRGAAATNQERFDQTVRWLLTLRPEADINTVTEALANGAVRGDIGERLIRRLTEARLRMLRTGRGPRLTRAEIP